MATKSFELSQMANTLTVDDTDLSVQYDHNGTFTGNLTIEGNLTVNGDTITITSTELAVQDNMIFLNTPSAATITSASGDGSTQTYTADNNYAIGYTVVITGMSPAGYNTTGATVTGATSTSFTIAGSEQGTYVSGGSASAKSTVNPDLGFVGEYNDGSDKHAGLFRDSTDGKFKFFNGYTPDPSTSINTADASFALGAMIAGEVGINTESPKNLLHVVGSNSNGEWRINDYGGMHFHNLSDPNNERYVHGRSDGSLSIGYVAIANLTGGTGGYAATTYDQLSIDSGGQVGVGTNAPAVKMHVYEASSASNLRIETAQTDGAAWLYLKNDARNWSIGAVGGLSDSFTIRDNNASAYRMAIDTSGNVGIGVTNPDVQLQVYSGQAKIGHSTRNLDSEIQLETSSGKWSAFSDYGTDLFGIYKYGTNAGRALIVDSNKNVGIGSDTPLFKLDVAGDARVTGSLTVSPATSGHTTFELGSRAADPLPAGSGSYDFKPGMRVSSFEPADGAVDGDSTIPLVWTTTDVSTSSPGYLAASQTYATASWSETFTVNYVGGTRWFAKIKTNDAESGNDPRVAVNGGTEYKLEYEDSAPSDGENDTDSWHVIDITDDVVTGSNTIKVWLASGQKTYVLAVYVFPSTGIALPNEPYETTLYADNGIVVPDTGKVMIGSTSPIGDGILSITAQSAGQDYLRGTNATGNNNVSIGNLSDDTGYMTIADELGATTFLHRADSQRTDMMGAVGINTTSNAYGLLQVNQINNNDEGGIGIVDSTAGRSMRLWCDPTYSYINSGDTGVGELILNQGGGNVGIATNNPAAPLQVQATGQILLLGNINYQDQYMRFRTQSDGVDFGLKTGVGANGSGVIKTGNLKGFGIAAGQTNTAFGDLTDDDMDFFIKSDGNVGIGTTDPTHKLHVESTIVNASAPDFPVLIAQVDYANAVNQLGGTGVGIQFNPATNSGDAVGGAIAAINTSASDDVTTTDLAFYVSDDDATLDEVVRFKAGGNVGIATTNPTETLDVNGIIHTRQYFQKEYNGQEILLRAQDSGGQWSIYNTINDSQGNYNIMLGVNGAGQYANTGDGGAKVYLTGHGTAGYTSINASNTGTAGNNVTYTIGLGVDSASNAVYVGNPNDNVGLDSTGEGFKIADNTGRIFGSDILGNLSYTSPGQIALSRSNNNPYLSFHNAAGARKGYLQHTGDDFYIANETTGEFFFTGGTTVSDPPRLVINATSQQTTAPGDIYGQIQFRVTSAAGVNASGLNGTDADTIAMITAQDFRNGSGKTNEDSGLGFYTSNSGTAMTYRGGISNAGKWFIGTWNNDNNGDSTALLNVNGSIYVANEVYASAATGWTENGNISSVYYDQDTVTINHTGSNAYNALVYGNNTYVNFKASVLFRTSNSDHWGIMFRGQASNPHDNSLQVIVRGSTLDDVRVQQRVAGVQTYLLPTPGSGNGAAVPNPDDGNWHLLEVQVYGNNIIVKIDGTVYISSTSLATQYSSGGTVGLTTYTANGTVDFKSFRVENLSGNTVQGPIEQYADIDMNDNDITQIGRLNFINHEGSDYGVTGDVMFDENFHGDTEYGSADNWPGGNGGGLSVYNEDGWGRIITDRNMQWLSGHFYGIGISPNSSADPSSRISALNIAGNDTAVFAGSDALYDKDHNCFINIANYSETSNVESGIVLRAKSTGAGVHAIYVKHRGTGTTYQGDLRFRSRNTSTTSQDNMTIRYDGNVGIGTTDPAGKLDIYGTNGQLFTIVDSFTGTIFSANDGSGVPSIEVLDTGIVRLAEFAGNVLVGTNTDDGSNKLQVNGGIMATADVTAYASSDVRLKTELQPIENALDKVNSLTGYTFNWNRAAQMNYGKDAEAREAGVIAQDVIEVLPEVTTTRDDGYMAVKYEKMVPLLIEAIKEQQTQINQLTELVNKLTSEK